MTGTMTIDDGSESCTYDIGMKDGCTLVPSTYGLLQFVATYFGDALNAPASSSSPLEVVPHGIGGFVAGLNAGEGIVLHLHAGSIDEDFAATNGAFRFDAVVPFGVDYRVTAVKPPDGWSCAVHDGSGQMPSSDVLAVVVSCGDRIFGDDFDG